MSRGDGLGSLRWDPVIVSPLGDRFCPVPRGEVFAVPQGDELRGDGDFESPRCPPVIVSPRGDGGLALRNSLLRVAGERFGGDSETLLTRRSPTLGEGGGVGSCGKVGRLGVTGSCGICGNCGMLGKCSIRLVGGWCCSSEIFGCGEGIWGRLRIGLGFPLSA